VSTDDLLNEARRRLEELEEVEGDELGDRVELQPGEHFAGRYRGPVTMMTKDGDSVPVVGLWGEDGRVRFHYKNASLVSELDEVMPDIGDKIVIVRGEDREYETGGELRRMHRYSVAKGRCSDPLPGARAPSQGAAVIDDADLPF
jgi:hypothetical protein